MKLRLHSALPSLLASILARLALLVCLSATTSSADILNDKAPVAAQTNPPVVALLAWQRVGSPLRMDA